MVLIRRIPLQSLRVHHLLPSTGLARQEQSGTHRSRRGDRGRTPGLGGARSAGRWCRITIPVLQGLRRADPAVRQEFFAQIGLPG
jgi:hypothetical protein